jgi:hypothetical protein
MRLSKFALTIAAFFAFSQANATTYNVNLNLPILGPGNVSGFIETDGSLGLLTLADIVDWNLVLTIGASDFTLKGPISGPNSDVGFFGSPALSATATQLLFDFSASTIETDRVQFQAPDLFSGTDFFCINGCGLQLSMGVGDLRAFGLAEGEVVIGTTSEVPLPAALPLFATALGMLGLVAHRRKRKQAAA